MANRGWFSIAFQRSLKLSSKSDELYWFPPFDWLFVCTFRCRFFQRSACRKGEYCECPDKMCFQGDAGDACKQLGLCWISCTRGSEGEMDCRGFYLSHSLTGMKPVEWYQKTFWKKMCFLFDWQIELVHSRGKENERDMMGPSTSRLQTNSTKKHGALNPIGSRFRFAHGPQELAQPPDLRRSSEKNGKLELMKWKRRTKLWFMYIYIWYAIKGVYIYIYAYLRWAIVVYIYI